MPTEPQVVVTQADEKQADELFGIVYHHCVTKYDPEAGKRTAARFLAQHASTARCGALPPFRDAWAKKEAEGYRYGGDALESVAFGYEIAQAELAALSPPRPERGDVEGPEEADCCPPHCCCCGPGERCCDCGEVMPSKTCIGEKCWCGAPAAMKVGEEIPFDDPMPQRHNLTSYICARHYAQLMGPVGAKQVGLDAKALSGSPS